MSVAERNPSLKAAVDFAYVQHLENSRVIHSLLSLTLQSAYDGGRRPLFAFLVDPIRMIDTGMSHPIRTPLLYGYSKTMQKSTNVRIPVFCTSQ